MFALMKRLSSAVCQLAERLARLRAEAARYEALAVDYAARAQLARARADAISQLLPTFDARVDPSKVEPVAAQGRHGKRGTFKGALLELLEASKEDWLTTSQVAISLRARLGLHFADTASEKHWRMNLLRPRLRELSKAGVLERRRAGPGHNDDACWRLARKPGAFSLDDLRALAEADGLAVTS